MLWVRLPSSVMSSLNGSSGFRIRGEFAELAFVVGIPVRACRCRSARRRKPCAREPFRDSLAASAGTMASRKGSATAVPMPRRKVRLGRDLRVIIVELSPSALTHLSWWTLLLAWIGTAGSVQSRESAIGTDSRTPPALRLMSFDGPAVVAFEARGRARRSASSRSGSG